MNRKTVFFLYLVSIQFLFLTGCAEGGKGQVPSTATPKPTLPAVPISTYTASFYTREEKAAAAVPWELDEYSAPTAGVDGSVACTKDVSVTDKSPRQAKFALSESDGKARFYDSFFIKTDDNLWTDEFTQFGVGDVTYTRTLKISAGQIEETTKLFSPSGDTATCINLWKPKE